jgi:hypothetical protein
MVSKQEIPTVLADGLGSSYNFDEFHKDFDGKTEQEIRDILSDWFGEVGEVGEVSESLVNSIMQYAN